jgi:hypothetical protein
MSDEKTNPCESVNLESVKNILKTEFAAQKRQLTDDLSQSLAQVNIEHQADVERQIEKLNKKIVGWYPFIIGLLITMMVSIALSFVIITWYHEKYLTENRFIRDQHEAELRDRGTTRSVKEVHRTDAQIDSTQKEQLKLIKR